MKKVALEALKKDFVTALRIINHQGLSDAFAHLSARIDGNRRMLFMPRKSPALVKIKDLFVVDFEKKVPQSSLHQAVYKAREDVRAVMHFHSPYTILLTVVGVRAPAIPTTLYPGLCGVSAVRPVCAPQVRTHAKQIDNVLPQRYTVGF